MAKKPKGKTTRVHTVYKDESGKRVPSVTTILKQWGEGSDAIHAWGINLVKQGYEPQDVLRQAGKIGTLFHYLCEQFFLGREADPEYLKEFSGVEIEQALMAYNGMRKWYTQFEGKLNINTTELIMVSEKHKYGGTLDLCGTTDKGEFWVLDFKSSKGIYKSHWVQVSAYAKLVEEKYGQGVNSIHILRCDKDSTSFDYAFRDKELIDRAFGLFLHLRGVYEEAKGIK